MKKRNAGYGPVQRSFDIAQDDVDPAGAFGFGGRASAAGLDDRAHLSDSPASRLGAGRVTSDKVQTAPFDIIAMLRSRGRRADVRSGKLGPSATGLERSLTLVYSSGGSEYGACRRDLFERQKRADQ
jgi:hypothetical protein